MRSLKVKGKSKTYHIRVRKVEACSNKLCVEYGKHLWIFHPVQIGEL